MEIEAHSMNADDDVQDLISTYLGRIVEASFRLTQDGNSRKEPSFSSNDFQHSLDLIARNLLMACRLDILTLSTEHLPKPKRSPVDLTRDVPRDESKLRPWRRIDYVRKLLRAMAPIAIDVAAHVSSLLVPNDSTINISQQDAEAFFILASVWLPIAPHVTPLASELFKLESFPSPLEHESNQQLSTGPHRIFLLAEASQNICFFFEKRGEIKHLLKWWNWSPILNVMVKDKNVESNDDGDVEMQDIDENERGQKPYGFSFKDATHWHASRVVAYLFQLSPKARGEYFQSLNVRESRKPWVMHPWLLDEEESTAQNLQLQGKAQIWDEGPFRVPSPQQIRQWVPEHPWLVHVGDGIVFVKHDPISSISSRTLTDESGGNKMKLEPSPNYLSATKDKRHNLTRTATTSENLALLGAAMCAEPHPPPILICGPHGSGKSSLIRELALIFSPSSSTYRDQLLEIHVDEETDAKTLIGTYTMTDIPGEFTWKPGALTQAVRAGKWVLMEDIDSVPIEIQASLVKLLEDRVLPLGTNGEIERCHPNFRLFGTCTISANSRSLGGKAGKKVLNSTYWRQVYVKPLPFSELKEIAVHLFPNLPPTICESALAILKALDRSGREVSTEAMKDSEENEDAVAPSLPEGRTLGILMTGGRHPSVRDFFKLLSRISNGIIFERDVKYATESQRTLCMAESVDIFLAACPDRDKRRTFIRNTVAPIWGLTADLALSYLDLRKPTTQIMDDFVEVGRAKLPIMRRETIERTRSETNNFTETSFSLRLMESIAVGIRENEPLLLVGETGCGKTSVIQHLAKYSERELIVQNLSLSTDSTDLLGGFRPLELQYVAQKIFQSFVDIFVGTFSRKQNAEFLKFASAALAKRDWKKLSQCFVRAAKLGLGKVKQHFKTANEEDRISCNASLSSWKTFSDAAERFERQRLACDSGLVFAFTEGALVDAIREGKWVLLDEINLASSEILQRLCGLLDDRAGSLTLTERGDAVAVKRHPDFRLFACMNPATDAGKKELHPSIRSRFTEIYVDELLDQVELRVVSSRYLNSVLPQSDKPPEVSDVVMSSVDVYLRCRQLAQEVLVDGSGHKPRYTLRTLARAMTASRNLVLEQRLPLKRAIVEGFELALQGPLDATSIKAVQRVLKASLGEKISKNERDHPGRRPGKNTSVDYILVKPFWIKAGPLEPEDWSQTSSGGRGKFILTPSASQNLRRLARAIASGPWPILLEGPTSAGKTTLVEYIAARVGHRIVRINNHEHTDVQEYTGSFAPDSNGSLSFQDGILVRALKRGDWVILDELNLAPSEVLEALNRLLDDNRELYLPEINQTIKPHPNFRLFATQNPSGAYGGRKPLSRAFRNRFVELYIADIPNSEMTTILELRCSCPPSHAKALVAIMDALRQRRSKSGVFLGKDGLITPRDLLRWAERRASSKLDLARDGYMLLAERLRTSEEKEIVREEIENQLKLSISIDELYFSPTSQAHQELQKGLGDLSLTQSQKRVVSSIAPTKSMLRLMTLIMRCIQQKEPVLLVGDTGCGKTTVVDILSIILHSKLQIINCHATTETSDLIGGLRPVRGRNTIVEMMLRKVNDLLKRWPDQAGLAEMDIPEFLNSNELSEPSDHCADAMDQDRGALELPEGAVADMIALVRSLWRSSFADLNVKNLESPAKRQKLKAGDSEKYQQDGKFMALSSVVAEIEDLFRRYSSLFEWVDGPVAEAMKSGHMLLLDELSLAEDAVLERLNSVLEPTRTLVLAEKGEDVGLDSEEDTRFISGHDNFRIFATMNPGGDYGKRELSPALRSRFTEIWVPAVDDMSDIELVLCRSLAVADEEIRANGIIQKMLAYVDWFNNKICSDKTSPFADLSLSLRDVLAWAQFIIKSREANQDLDLWNAYCHGAALMHLDGLGLGTGLAVDQTRALRTQAQEFLFGQAPSTKQLTAVSTDVGDKLDFTVSGHLFGVHPFWVQTGRQQIRKSSFNFAAPRTADNVFRVLRAMQLPKPILLEGPPGVGKTSLVLALANAAGHKLIRINLSEQTDMSDLMGSDLPVPEKNSDGVMQASFKWCDGVLLTAIKNGDWVLLDELNLASQSVLEGLNSCLDYRASVFVPELGKTFQCPPTFRVFAAQNPMAQGGGRKGLPRSFLNRFTKCHVDSLTGYDLRAIVSSKYPLLSAELVDKMVQFNERVHSAIVVHHEFGLAGTPWEFNLRDVFRWADLLVAVNGYQSTRACSLAARDIYLQRFRTRKDRDYLQSIYSEVFGSKVIVAGPVDFMVMDQAVKVGDTVLPRLENGKVHGFDTYRKEPAVFKSLLRPMEAVARCIHMKWPCLLVGGPGSGKTAVLNGLSELCNAKLIEVALSPSSDVNELVGNFEQMDIAAKDRESLRAMEHIASMYVLKHRFSAGFNHRVCELLFTLTRVLEELSDSEQSILTRNKSLKALAEVLLEALESAAKSLPVFGTVYGKAINEAKSHIKRDSRQDADDSHFRWVDGVLAKAMTEGYWLLLENVNLCPSSVLDRLNPVMEKDGELLMAECGIQEDGNDKFSHRTITAHPNFRLFLSMDPDHGEVSRAMRNRCVEVAFLQPQPFSGTIHKDETFVDSMDVAWRAGLRSSKLANGLLKSYDMLYDNAVLSGMEPPSIKIISESAALGACLLAHGGTAKDTSRILSSVFSVNLPMYVADRASSDSASLLTVPLLRFSWLEFPQQAAVDWDSRLLRLFLGWSQQLPAAPVLMPNGDKLFDGSLAISENLVEKYEKVCPSLSGIASEALQLRDNFAALTLASSSREGLMMRLACLDGHNDDFARTYETLAKICRPIALQLLKSASLKNWEVFNLIRLPQKISERVWFERMASMNSISVVSSELTVLDVSFLMQEGRMDRSCISCQVTPVLYPLFQALDSWIAEVFDLVYNWVKDSRANDLLDLCLRCLSQKDRLWLWLRNHPFSFTDDGFLAFDEAKFIVQWKWFKKNLRLFEMSYQVHESTPMREKRSQVNILIETIDAFVFGEGGDRSGIGASIWKKVSHPLVPRKASQWLAVEQLRKLAKSYSIRDDPSLEKQDILELDDLIKAHHPALFVHNRDKAELLLALCMVHWSFTDEISGEMRARPLSFSVEDARTAIMEQWDDKRKQFMAQIEAMKIDASIDTVENQIGLDDLKQLASGAVDASKTDFTGVSDRILCNFGRLQFALCSEKWCSNREVELMRDICELVLESNDPCRLWDGLSSTIALRARDFLEAALTWTTWPVSDLRPYQTLIWACESPSFPQENAVNFIRCLMPAISSASLKHSMAISSYTPPKTISERMEMPALFDTDSSRQDPSSQLIMDHKPMKAYSSWILTDTVLGLVGGLLSTSRSSRAKKTLFATMENHRARAIQSRDFIKVLSAASVTGAPRSPFEISYFLGETLTAMPPSSLSIDLSTEDINEMVRSRDFSRAVKLAEACPHTVVQNLFKPVIVPLFDSLSVVWEGGPTLTRDCGDSLPLAFAYFGLLRFHLLMPDSPVDPGRTPLAKMEVLGAHLKDLRIQIAAIRLHSGFCHGDFSPDTDYVRKLLDDSLSLHEKRLGQEAKVVERVAQAPPFVEFFREVRDFSRNLCSKETVLDLIKVIREAAMSPSQALQAGERVDNWQRSAGAFRERLLSYFWAYEDIVVPLVDSICFLQSGLRDFLDFHLPSQTKLARHDDTLRICLRYPMGDFNGDLNEVWETMQSLSSANKAEVKTQRALGFALLSRFVLRKLMSGLDPHITQCCRSIFDSLVAKELQGNDDASKDTDSEDLQEKLFREQFPDHRSEFNALLRSDEGTEETAVGDLDDSQVSVYAEMSHEERNKLCIFHRLLFSSEVGIQDSDRIWAFRECFSAADNILSTSGSPSRTSEELVGTAGHVFALSLASSPRNACALRDVSSRLGSGANIQFYRDANPEEVIKAAPAIEHLIARITQLLTAFPGNEILLGVFKVADKVRKLDLHSAPIGKAMIGLEVILRHAQDWEQHASERARLGNALVEVSRVVAMWRKLELDSWKDLLSSREHRFLEQARRHWTRLYKMFHADQASSYGYSNVCLNSLNESSDQWSPRWVWKGLAKHARALFPSLVDTPSSELLELGKVLDTFMLTSPLGEYKERLALIKSFSEQLLHEAQGISEELRLSRMQCSRLLSSLWLYYRQYSSFISTKLETLRAPIESNLRDQMKLAKWDEQSYYALAESSEKNHRNLMKCLREYDDALDMNVGDLLERELNFGIRSESVSTQEEPSTSVPPDSLFFPMIPKGKTLSASSAPRSLNRIPSVERDWTNLSSVASDLDSYAGKIGRYASKILSMLQKQKHSGVSWSGIGKTNARDLCDSIFHRIESLRSGKASRQMKERALVDLFKTLKKNGYSNTKWSTPKESREMMQLFQLPSPAIHPCGELEAQSSILRESEDYYLRFVSELRRFRTEVDVIGSKYMTSRQTEMMLSFCEHGLLMISQQRCLISTVLLDFASLTRRVNELSFDGTKLAQSQLLTKTLLLDSKRSYLSATENIKQLFLLIKMSRPVLSQGGPSIWARETMGDLEALVSDLTRVEISSPSVVTEKETFVVRGAQKVIDQASAILQSRSKENVSSNYIPHDAFDECLVSLNEASSNLSSCLRQIESPDNHPAPPIDEKTAKSLIDAVSSAVKHTLLAVQPSQRTIETNVSPEDGTGEDKEAGMWSCHSEASREWAEMNLKNLNTALERVFELLHGVSMMYSLHSRTSKTLTSLISDLGVLCQLALAIIEKSLDEFIQFHRDSSKFHYVLIRVFRILVSKGYCSDDVSEEDGGNDGDASGMNFEDNVEGTGMGEGDGKQDVTDQLENEEQLLGLQDNKENDEQGNQQDRDQLNEEEAEQGMEMEGQFEGEMYDMPDKKEGDDDDAEDNDNEEELDREMGLDDDPNEQVVDEKMWEESDDEKEMDEGDEKFEKNSNMQGAQQKDQVRTKEDDEADNQGTEGQNEEDNAKQMPQSGEQDSGEQDEGDNRSDHDDINEDLEDNYEDNHGVDVREEPTSKEDLDDSQEQPMELDDNLQLDEENDGEKENPDDPQDELHCEEGIDQQAEEENNPMDEVDSNEEPNNESPEDDAQMPSATLDDTDMAQNEKEEDTEEEEPPKVNLPSEPEKQNEGLGVRAVDGQDACQDTGQEDESDQGEGADGQDEMETTGAQLEKDPSGMGGSGSGERGNEGALSGESGQENEALNEAPNPFKNPGDATKFWHQKLNMVETENTEDTLDTGENPSEEQQHGTGEFEYVSEEQKNSTTQVLGEVTEDQAVELEQRNADEDAMETNESKEPKKQDQEKGESKAKKSQSSRTSHQPRKADDSSEVEIEPTDDKDDNSEAMENIEEEEQSDEDSQANDGDVAIDDGEVGNRVVSDLSRLKVDEDFPDSQTRTEVSLIEDQQVAGISSAETSEARARWARIQGETYTLALRLCEKLRLVMEPLVASKLRGDYRTGKRINMKRVIGYIASGYRKDKIWLRRTKPAKRNYRVLLAVDDSESMLKCGTGEMALRAMATLAVGMSQLEIGELGVASFGDDMKLLHPFDQPFTSESGVDVVKNFKFDQPRTRTALCVESALSVLDTPGDAESVQLMFLISDGRIERDSRLALKRLIREMMERNILLAMIIVEGGDGDRKEKKNDSILNMKEVTFEKGKPKVKRFIEDYPFPFYVVIDHDVQTLPEVLGDALRQWFELQATIAE